jgi:hypothetical protein
MASTRNLNNPADYSMEQKKYSDRLDYLTNRQNMYGAPKQSHFAGDGLLMGRMAAENLDFNACNVESFLFGIGSTNLVNPKGEVKPDSRYIQSLSIMDKTALVMPDPLIVQKNQRPYPK